MFSQEQYDKLQEVIDTWKSKPGPLIPVLQQAQEIFGYLPLEVQQLIAEGLGVPVSEVFGVSTFYAQFTLKAKGKHRIAVCLGTACYVKGSQSVLDELEKELGIKAGDTTEDGMFTLEATRCLGCCGLAPVMTVDGEVYGKLVPSKVKGILAKYN